MVVDMASPRSRACVLYYIHCAHRLHRGWRDLLLLFDDAMISMRYARNFAEGYGLIWNPGQAPIEGYTNWLWTLCKTGSSLLQKAATRDNRF
jgi:hypothetical protein